MKKLLADVYGCTLCQNDLPFGPRPVLQMSTDAKILIAGQAPGRRVHESGIPFDDPSGDRLREWMGIDRDDFYDETKVAILPMGFCYPGTGKSGDLPPRPECASTWRNQLLSQLKKLELTLVIGQYALKYHIPSANGSLTEIVKNRTDYPANIIPLPHPSPRNNIWLKRNPWFQRDILPTLKLSVSNALGYN